MRQDTEVGMLLSVCLTTPTGYNAIREEIQR